MKVVGDGGGVEEENREVWVVVAEVRKAVVEGMRRRKGGVGWLVEDLQAAHGQPHVSRERLVHGGVVQGQENRHVGLQWREVRRVVGEEAERRGEEGREGGQGSSSKPRTPSPVRQKVLENHSHNETGRQIAGYRRYRRPVGQQRRL